MSTTVDNSIDLNLPVVPLVREPTEIFQELLRIYNAIRSLATGIDIYTSNGELELETQLILAQANAKIELINLQLKAFADELNTLCLTVSWGQPGEIGSNIPNAATFSKLNVTGDTTLTKFGANGKAASAAVVLPAVATDAASTQTLSNALRAAFITFGLGV